MSLSQIQEIDVQSYLDLPVFISRPSMALVVGIVVRACADATWWINMEQFTAEFKMFKTQFKCALQRYLFSSLTIFHYRMLTICIVSESVDMEPMFTFGQPFNFPCQLHRSAGFLRDESNTTDQEIGNTKEPWKSSSNHSVQRLLQLQDPKLSFWLK